MASARKRSGWGAVWLWIPVLLLGSGFRPSCDCMRDAHAIEAGARVATSCCDAPKSEPREPAGSQAPCCCVDGGPERAAPPERASAPQLAALWHAPPHERPRFIEPERGQRIAPRPQRDHSPPLFLIDCSFRC